MRLLVLTCFLLSSPAFACWNMNAVLSVDSNELIVNQKLEHDKTYSFSKGNIIFHVKIPLKTSPAGSHQVLIEAVEKIGLTLSPVSQFVVLAKAGTEALVTSEDPETHKMTSAKLTLTEI